MAAAARQTRDLQSRSQDFRHRFRSPDHEWGASRLRIFRQAAMQNNIVPPRHHPELAQPPTLQEMQVAETVAIKQRSKYWQKPGCFWREREALQQKRDWDEWEMRLALGKTMLAKATPSSSSEPTPLRERRASLQAERRAASRVFLEVDEPFEVEDDDEDDDSGENDLTDPKGKRPAKRSKSPGGPSKRQRRHTFH